MAFYLGKRAADDLILFRSSKVPTKGSHGHLFTSVIGPFKSRVAASWFARYGRIDLRMHNADEIELLARADPRMEQAIVEENMTDEELVTALECNALDQIEYSPSRYCAISDLPIKFIGDITAVCRRNIGGG